MQAPRSRRRVGPVSFYLLCLLCLLAVFWAGWYGMETQQLYYREVDTVREVNDAVQTARRFFVEMRMLSAQRTLWRDVSLTARQREIHQDFFEILRRWEGTLDSEGTRLLRETEENVSRYVACDEKLSDLLMVQEKILYEWAAITDTLTKAVFDVSERAVQRMHEAKIEHENALFLPERPVQRIQAIDQILREVQDQRRMMMILNFEPNTEKRQVIVKELSERFENTAKLLTEFQKSAETSETVEKRLLEDIIAIFAQCRKVGESIVEVMAEADGIEAEKEKIAAKATDDFEKWHEIVAVRFREFENMAYHTAQMMQNMLLASAMVAIISCLVSGYFLSVRGGGTTLRSNPYDPHTTNAETSRDLSEVAGKLQEVVDLLRR